ncbi:hypothetical protein BDD12DRAFT_901136 [Trichophaea hybrida]|nr:hypothetical protein BDD12DRAFT_901136 [Trichophaea hybrida]
MSNNPRAKRGGRRGRGSGRGSGRSSRNSSSRGHDLNVASTPTSSAFGSAPFTPPGSVTRSMRTALANASSSQSSGSANSTPITTPSGLSTPAHSSAELPQPPDPASQLPLTYGELVIGMFYRAVFMFPDHFVDEVSPLSRYQQNARYPVFKALHMPEMGPNNGLYMNRPAPPGRQTKRYSRPVLVTAKNNANGSIAVFICSSSPRGSCTNSHRWMPIGAAPHLPNQPLPGVQVIPQQAMNNQAYLCFTHTLQVTPVGAFASPLASTQPGNANFNPSFNNSTPPHHQIKCGNLAHVLEVHRSYWDGIRYDAKGRAGETEEQTQDYIDSKEDEDNGGHGTEHECGADRSHGTSEEPDTDHSSRDMANSEETQGGNDPTTEAVQITMSGEMDTMPEQEHRKNKRSFSSSPAAVYIEGQTRLKKMVKKAGDISYIPLQVSENYTDHHHPWFEDSLKQECSMSDYIDLLERTSNIKLVPHPDLGDELAVLKWGEDAHAAWGGRSFWDSDEEEGDETTTYDFQPQTGLPFGNSRLITPVTAFFYPIIDVGGEFN